MNKDKKLLDDIFCPAADTLGMVIARDLVYGPEVLGRIIAGGIHEIGNLKGSDRRRAINDISGNLSQHVVNTLQEIIDHEWEEAQ